MSGNLAQAEVIGGAVVTITGDLSGLRAAHAEGKRLTMAASNDLKMVATATINTTQFNSTLQMMKRQAQETVAEINRTFSRMSNLGIGSGAGLDFKGRSGGGGELAGEQAANRRQWQADSRAFVQFLREEHNDRIRLAREVGEKEGAAYLEGQERVYNRYRNRGGGGSGGGAPRRGGGRIRQLDDVFENFLPGTFNAAFKIGGAIAISKAVGGLINVGADMIEMGPRAGLEGAVQGIDSLMGNGGSGLNRIQRGLFGASLGDKLVQFTNASKLTDTETFAERQAFDKYEAGRERQMAKMIQSSERRMVSERVVRSAKAYAIGGAEGMAVQALDDFNEQLGSDDSPTTRSARAILQGRVSAARGRDNEAMQAAYGRSNAAGWGVRSMRELRAGDGDAAFMFGQFAASQGLAATQRGRLAGVTDPKQRAMIMEENAAESAIFGEQQEQERLDRKLAKTQMVNAKIAAEDDAKLRLQKRNYEADLAAFDAAAREKLETIRDTNEKQLASAIIAAQRSVIVAEQQQRIAATNTSLDVAARQSELRADGRNMQADLEAFDAETEAGLQNVDAANREAYIKSRERQRASLVKTQARSNASFGRGIDARIASAGAAGMGRDRLAGVIGRIAGAREELEAADPARRGAIARAQQAELGAYMTSMVRSRDYAREFDPLREARGGPTGDDGKEMLEVLKTIADYLRDIKDQPGGLR